MRVGKQAEEVERVDPAQGRIRIGKDASQDRYVADNPMTPVDVVDATLLLERLRVGKSGTTKFSGNTDWSAGDGAGGTGDGGPGVGGGSGGGGGPGAGGG